MATRPDKLPRFATGGSASVVEPSEGKKDAGWEADEMPPAGYFNWLHRLTFQAIDWLVERMDFILATPDSVRVGAPGGPSYESGWSDSSGEVLRVYKDQVGRVFIDGMTRFSGSGVGGRIFILPVEFRPENRTQVVASIEGAGTAFVQVGTDGAVDVLQSLNNDLLIFSGTSFHPGLSGKE